MNKKQIFWLAAKTFIQAFVGYIGSANVTDDKTLRIVLAAAIASGLCALMNTDWEKLAGSATATMSNEEITKLIETIASVDWSKLTGKETESAKDTNVSNKEGEEKNE